MSARFLSFPLWIPSVGQGQAFKHGEPLGGGSIESGRLSATGASAAAVAVLQRVLRGETLESSRLHESSMAPVPREQLAVIAVLHGGEGSAVVAVKVISMAEAAARDLWLQDQRNVVDVSGAGTGLIVAKLECNRLPGQGVTKHWREEIGRRRRHGGSAAEAQVWVVEGRE